jgi:SAM-dependent methyltransferase
METVKDSRATGHWSDIAGQWEQVGPPLRPSSQDIAIVTDVIERWADRQGAPRAMILGVTPELYRIPWRASTDLLAVDRSRSMIDKVWPGPRTNILCADWIAMPLKEQTRDIILCDGGLHLLPYPNGHLKFVDELQHVVAHNGIFVLRLFVPPPRRETWESVLRDLVALKIPNVNILKLRLWMALHEDIEHGVQLHCVWDTIRKVEQNLPRLATRLGWPTEQLLALDTYQNCDARYYFLDVPQVRRMFCTDRAGFVFESIHFPTYDLGDQCPTIVLRRVR